MPPRFRAANAALPGAVRRAGVRGPLAPSFGAALPPRFRAANAALSGAVRRAGVRGTVSPARGGTAAPVPRRECGAARRSAPGWGAGANGPRPGRHCRPDSAPRMRRCPAQCAGRGAGDCVPRPRGGTAAPALRRECGAARRSAPGGGAGANVPRPGRHCRPGFAPRMRRCPAQCAGRGCGGRWPPPGAALPPRFRAANAALPGAVRRAGVRGTVSPARGGTAAPIPRRECGAARRSASGRGCGGLCPPPSGRHCRPGIASLQISLFRRVELWYTEEQ